MKKTKLITNSLVLLLFLTSILYLESAYAKNNTKRSIETFQKSPIDCGTWFGTSCKADGPGCASRGCDNPPFAAIE